VKHLLVIRLSALGDVAIMVPVLRAYAWANPTIRFTVAAPPLLEPLFEGMNNVEFLGVKKQQSAHTIYKQLKSVGADTVADLHHVNRVIHAVMLMRIDALLHFHPLRVCSLRKGRLSRWLFLHHLVMHPRKSQADRYANVFNRLGLDNQDGLVSINYQTSHIQVRPANTNTIGIAPFAQHKGKIWPFENTCRLAIILAEKGFRVILFGGADEARQLDALASQHESITSLAGKQTFREELDIIRHLTLMVSMDSANMHFASALSVPVVSIWGATHPDFGFYGYAQPNTYSLCANLPCQPCSAYGNRPCRYGDYRCMKAITPEQVMAVINQVINDRL